MSVFIIICDGLLTPLYLYNESDTFIRDGCDPENSIALVQAHIKHPQLGLTHCAILGVSHPSREWSPR